MESMVDGVVVALAATLPGGEICPFSENGKCMFEHSQTEFGQTPTCPKQLPRTTGQIHL